MQKERLHRDIPGGYYKIVSLHTVCAKDFLEFSADAETFLKGRENEEYKIVNNFGFGRRSNVLCNEGQRSGTNGYGLYIPGSAF